ncbi:MAG: RNA-binding transcriptional accessory protein [Bacilli bacterium]|nr:RNA-binding transcriptional accessory protein [Bacilli bacterium]
MNIITRISEELSISEKRISSAIGLMDEGSTVPFIARYRKEVTGGLTDTELRSIEERLSYLRKLQERMDTVIASIEEQGKMSDELRILIDNAKTLTELEDIYRPYKPKKKTRASIAKEKGLEPLAKYIRKGRKYPDFSAYLSSFINIDKGVATEEDALKGASDIIAEEISDNAEYRKYARDYIYGTGYIVSKEIEKDEKDTYHNYADYKEKIKFIPPHRILAINRGEAEKCLKVKLDYSTENIHKKIAYNYTYKNDFASFLDDCIEDAMDRLILPSVENEVRNELTEKAEDSSIITFKKNLKSLLLVPPLKGKTILGFDPGFRTGCKYALVNKNGIPEEVGVFNITAASNAEIERARRDILFLLRKHKIDYIALGNGTASRESEAELSKIIKDNNLDVKIFIVNESGASVYSASPLGEAEFPNLSVEKRSAISLARRLQDPLNELVKIEPKAMGVGQYQHDMNQKKLEEALHGVVEDSVNSVGVNLNNATPSILNYVSGINKTLAANIYAYLKENGEFKSRSELKNVAKLGPKAFEQCAGFLRIYGGIEPLDTTSIHPESYKEAKSILKKTGIDILKDSLDVKEDKLSRFDVNAFRVETGIGESTLQDIIEEIKIPGRDIREDVEVVELNNDVKDIKDLKVGMVLNGTVRNIMDFGMFVDINVHQDGLVHISELSKTFVKSIIDLYSIGDVVKVKVISVDVAKKRIGLSIKQLD